MNMSAYIVADRTINRIVTWLKSAVATNRHFTLERLARKYTIDLPTVAETVPPDQWDEKLATAMFQLNCDAVNGKYGAGEAEKFRPLNFTYKPEPYVSKVQVFKALQCWMYQCDEGDVPETPLYQFFEEVEKYLAVQIVWDLPEYHKAEWE